MSRLIQLRPVLLAATLGAASVFPAILAAQSGPRLRQGTQVRVVLPAATPGEPDSIVPGRLVRLVNDTVIIETAGAGPTRSFRGFDLHGGRQLRIFVGAHSHAVRGVLVGAAAGALVVGGIAYATYRPCQGSGPWDCLFYESRESDTKIGAGLGAVVGSLIGLVIGSTSHGGHWVPVDTRGIQVSLGPGRVGLRMAL